MLLPKKDAAGTGTVYHEQPLEECGRCCRSLLRQKVAPEKVAQIPCQLESFCEPCFETHCLQHLQGITLWKALCNIPQEKEQSPLEFHVNFPAVEQLRLRGGRHLPSDSCGLSALGVRLSEVRVALEPS